MKFVAELKFSGNDVECERLYDEYKRAKGRLQSYLMDEGVDLGMDYEKKNEAGKTASDKLTVSETEEETVSEAGRKAVGV